MRAGLGSMSGERSVNRREGHQGPSRPVEVAFSPVSFESSWVSWTPSPSSGQAGQYLPGRHQSFLSQDRPHPTAASARSDLPNPEPVSGLPGPASIAPRREDSQRSGSPTPASVRSFMARPMSSPVRIPAPARDRDRTRYDESQGALIPARIPAPTLSPDRNRYDEPQGTIPDEHRSHTPQGSATSDHSGLGAGLGPGIGGFDGCWGTASQSEGHMSNVHCPSGYLPVSGLAEATPRRVRISGLDFWYGAGVGADVAAALSEPG